MPKTPEPAFPVLDLRHLTCAKDDRRRTTIFLETSFEVCVEWITVGSVSLMPWNDRRSGRWSLESKIAGGATDFDHSTVRIVRLPLIGLEFEHASGAVRFHAWIDPGADDSEFRVPPPDYDPVAHPKTHTCKDGPCAKNPHPIVPEGLFLPPFNRELFEQVRGKRVEIVMHQARSEEP